MRPRILEKFEKEVAPQLLQDFGLKNKMQAPKLTKILVSMCIKEAASDMKAMDRAMADVATITGQKPKLTRAKKAIANFKLREGVPLGCVSTLRGKRMWEFFDRLTNVALPRVRDFRGVPGKGFDGNGNYSLGLKDQILFPEINYDKVDKMRGMNITFVTSATTDEQGYALLDKLGMPFRKK
ncbi:MAG: 50S ribosomal protein L5 [Bdellovibrionota bacterium]